MKWLKILICNIFILLLMASNVSAKYIGLKMGLYDFISPDSRIFYKVSPILLLEYNLFEFNCLDLNLSAGIAYNEIRYNDTRHKLTMYPAFVSVMYNLPNGESKVKPYFGSGIGFVAKFDKNQWLPEAHSNYTYGYNVLVGLKVAIKAPLTLAFSMQYNSLAPPNNEAISINGVLSSIELRYNLGRKSKKDK